MVRQREIARRSSQSNAGIIAGDLRRRGGSAAGSRHGRTVAEIVGQDLETGHAHGDADLDLRVDQAAVEVVGDFAAISTPRFIGPGCMISASGLSIKVSPLTIELVGTDMLITSPPSRWPASSNEVRVRVELSKKQLMIVRPRKVLRLLSASRFSST